MSFYRTLFAALAAVVIASPVFADDDAIKSTDTTTQTTETSSTTTTTDAVKVNLNKATAKELMKVKGINAAHAKAIVSYRKKHGDFKTVEDLASIKAFKKMKEDKLKEIEGQLSIE
jgi:competence protein ComEA